MKIKNLVLSTITAGFLIGCGGGGGSSSSNSNENLSNVTYGGSVIDGYIQNADVCLDLSLDGVCDNSEPFAKTNENGTYSLEITPTQQNHQNFAIAPIIAYGGTDKDTGADFTGKLQSQVSGNSANITPLTTILSQLIQEEVSSATSKTDLDKKIAEKKELVRTAFNLPTGVNVEDDFLKSQNTDLTKVALKIQKTVDLISEVGTDGSKDNKELSKDIFKIIKEKVKTASANSDVLTDTIEEAKTTTTISGFVLDDTKKAKLDLGQEQIKVIVDSITSNGDVKEKVSLIESKKTEIKNASTIDEIEKYTKDNIPSGNDLKIVALQNFLQVLGVIDVETAKGKATSLVEKGVTKTNLIEKFTSTFESDVTLQNDYPVIKDLVVAYNKKLEEQAKSESYAVKAIKVLDNMNIETDNVDTKIADAKKLVEGLTLNDAVMVKNMLSLTTIMDSEEVKNVLDIDDSADSKILETSIIGKLVKSTVKDTILFNEKYNGIANNSKIVMNKMATQLKTISDSIGTVFTNENYVFGYGSENITYNDSLAIRGAILAIAFKLDFIASYSWGDDEDIKTRTEIIDNTEYEYQNINVDMASVLNKGNAFKIDSASRIDGARAYLLEGLELANKLPNGYENTTKKDKEDLQGILSSLKGESSYELLDNREEYSWDRTKWQLDNNYRGDRTIYTTKYYVDLSKLLNSSYAIDITSFGSNFEMACTNMINGDYSLKDSKILNQETCLYITGVKQPPVIPYKASLILKTKPTTSTSKFDDVITKIITEDNEELTGQSVIDFITDDL